MSCKSLTRRLIQLNQNINYLQANFFFQTILINSPLRRSTVKNVIILFSLLFVLFSLLSTASKCVCTQTIPLGCLLDVNRIKSMTNAKRGRGW